MHLCVVHEEALDAHSNNVNSPTMGCRSGIPFTNRMETIFNHVKKHNIKSMFTCLCSQPLINSFLSSQIWKLYE